MTKAALFSIGLAAMLATPVNLMAQDNTNNAIKMAVNQSVLNQANTIVLRNKLADAKAVQLRGDVQLAAKLYQECVTLAQQIGSGIDFESAQAVSGLSGTRLTLARDAQSRGDFREADVQIQQVLKADPKNSAAIAFKQQNDKTIADMKGRIPDAQTLDKVPQLAAQKKEAGTMVQNGKLLYEMGQLEEAEVQLSDALKLDPDSSAANYYLNLIQQAKIQREYAQHMVDTQTRMAHVEKQWVLPTARVQLPVPNPYATNTLVYTGPGRQGIISKLDRIRLDNVSFDGLPLSEVLRNLAEQSRLRDPERKGVNFLINPNADLSGLPVAAPANAGFGGGGGGFGVQPGIAAAPMPMGGGAVDPATGLPMATSAFGSPLGDEVQDVATVSIKIPSLTDVRLADVLDAIVLVAERPIKYSIQDFAIVFSSKGPETPQLFTRTFKVDPNTFYSGLESVGALSFGSTSQSSSGGSSGGGGGGGGGGNNENSGAVVGVVNAFSGSAGMRSTGNGQGGGGGGGGQGQGSGNPLNGAQGGAGGGGGNLNSGGLNYITQVTLASQVSAAARAYFTALGVNLENPVGKAVFFNDKTGILLVKATEQDLDTVERAIQALNQVAPQVHIKARFIEVEQADNKALGFDWYLGNFSMGSNGKIVTQGGTAASKVYDSQGNVFPNPPIPTASSDQLVSSGLRQSAPTLGTITGIMTDPQFRVAIRALEQRNGVESLGEPEVTTTSGRQTQMRATSVITVVVGLDFQEGSAPQSSGTTTGQ